MPIYSFRCFEHGVFDLDMPVEWRDDIHVCESCGERMSRVWTVPTTVLKGGGFYRTEYRNRDKAHAQAQRSVDRGEAHTNLTDR